MVTQRGLERLMVLQLSVFSSSFLVALTLTLLLPAQRSLESAESYFLGSMVAIGVFTLTIATVPVLSLLKEASLLREWHTTDIVRLRPFLLGIPVFLVIGSMASVVVSSSLGGISMEDAAIVEGIALVALFAHVVLAPRYLVPPDRGASWEVRRFDFNVAAFQQRVRTAAEALGLTAMSTRGVLTLSDDNPVAVVRPRPRGGLYARVRSGASAEALKSLLEAAATEGLPTG